MSYSSAQNILIIALPEVCYFNFLGFSLLDSLWPPRSSKDIHHGNGSGE
jgi:hypothetical protein